MRTEPVDWIRYRERLLPAGITLLLSLAVLSCFPIPIPVPDHDAAAVADLQHRLQTQGAVTVAGGTTVSLIVRLPGAKDHGGFVTLEPRPSGKVPRHGLIQDSADALAQHGIYLSVQNGAGEIVHAVRVGGHPFLVSERNSGGVIQPYFQSADAWVISTNVPFEPGGVLRVFEVDDTGTVVAVLLGLSLGPDPSGLPRVRLRRRV